MSFMGMTSSQEERGNANLPPATSLPEAGLPGEGLPPDAGLPGTSIGNNAVVAGIPIPENIGYRSDVDTDDAVGEDLKALEENCQFIRDMMRNMSLNKCDTNPEMRRVISHLHSDLRVMLGVPEPEQVKDKFISGRSVNGRTNNPATGETGFVDSDTSSSDEDVKPGYCRGKKGLDYQRKKSNIVKEEAVDDTQLSRSLVEVLSQFDNRRAPKPEEFDMASGRSFRSFLVSFEEYCSHTFRGSSALWCSELKGFLKGSILQTYEALHSPGESYEEIRERLLQWCNDVQGSVSRSNKRKFDDIQMRKNEPLRLYAARVERQFRLSYPRKRVGTSKTLIRKFVETVPPTVRKSILNAKSILSLQDQDLDWKLTLKLVGSYEMEGLEPDVLDVNDSEIAEVWAVQPPQPPPTIYSKPLSTGYSQSSPVVYSGQSTPGTSSSAPPHQGSPTKVTCFYCKRPGHIKSDCWRFNKRCLSCGSPDHRIANCPDRGRVRSSSNAARQFSRSPPGSQQRSVTFSAPHSDDARQDMGNPNAPTVQGTSRRS